MTNIYKNKIEIPILKIKIKDHDNIKNYLLQKIEEDVNGLSMQNEESKNQVVIEKTDWNFANDMSGREWTNFIAPIIFSSIREHFLTYTEIRFFEMWYQQYVKENEHSWHTHGHNFTGIYYVELPLDSPKTEIYKFNTKETMHIDSEEGYILIMPSFIIHRSSKNISNQRKTIISFNFSVSYTDGKQ